jgi:hypothetical protein
MPYIISLNLLPPAFTAKKETHLLKVHKEALNQCLKSTLPILLDDKLQLPHIKLIPLRAASPAFKKQQKHPQHKNPLSLYVP